MRRAVVHCGNDALFGADHKRMIKKLLLSCLRSRGYDLVKRTTNDRTSAEDSPPRVHYPPTLWLEKHGIGTILDIGANEGDFAITMASRFPEAKIVSFEPLADAFATLVRRTACQPRCRAMQCAIGDSEGGSGNPALQLFAQLLDFADERSPSDCFSFHGWCIRRRENASATAR